MGVLLWQMEFRQWTPILSRRTVGWKRTARRTVKRLVARVRPTRGRTMQRISQDTNPTVQLIVNLPKLPVALKLIRREAKSRQHDHEDEAIPELQPPLDGFEKFHLGTTNIQHRTSNNQFSECAPSAHWMFDVGCWMLDVFIYSMQ